MQILGLSGLYHDSAAALIVDGKVVAAAHEERFSRKKHDAGFPSLSAQYCLKAGGVQPQSLDAIVFYEKPFLKFERILMTHFRVWPKAFRLFQPMLEAWLTTKLRIPSLIRREILGEQDASQVPLLFVKHHEAHAGSAFYASPFESAAVVTLDGVGEWTTTGIFHGRGNRIQALEEIRYPDSLGLFYSAFTSYLGFEVNEDEYKVMGLAPYGKPRFVDLLKEHMIHLREDGSFELQMEFFDFEIASRMMAEQKVKEILGFPKRNPKEELTQEHKDLAASVQVVLEEAVVGVCRRALQLSGEKHLCLAGGVALNCVANSKLRQLVPAENIYVFPASGDAGGAVGAALFAAHELFKKERVRPWGEAMPDVFLGPEFSQAEMEDAIKKGGLPYEVLSQDDLMTKVASLIADQKVVGWFQGRMEYGPRALGNRSILGDPTRKENWPKINQKVKFREDFRPLAPAVLEERAQQYFEFEAKSPYMLFTAQVKTAALPAVTHVDQSARLQTVSKKENVLFHRLIEEVEKRIGVPIVINTSFNTSGMAIVCTPQDALQCFEESDLDVLVLGQAVVHRAHTKRVN